MELRQNDLDGRDLLLGMLADGDAASVVDDRDGVIFVNGDVDSRAVSCKRLVDRIVNDLVHQMM